MFNSIGFRKFVRIILAFFSTCFLVLMLWVVIDCFTAKSNATEKVITYTINDGISYDVILKENQFYTNEESKKNNRYVTALMDTLQVYFNYELAGNKFFSGEYGYTVNLRLISNHNGAIVWKYEEEVVPRVSSYASDVMKFDVKDSVIIDINSLYSRAKEFNELTGYDVRLSVDVVFDSSLAVSGYSKKINDKQNLSLSIPLTKKVVSISTVNDNSVNRNVLTHYEVDEKFNAYLFIVSGLIIVSLIPLTVMSYVSLFNLVNLDDYYRKLSILRKKYARFIKVVDKKPDFKNKEVMEVITCGELARLCLMDEDLFINLYIDEDNKISLFYVVYEDEVYLYILKRSYEHIELSDKSKVISINKNGNKEKGKDKVIDKDNSKKS